MFPGEIMDEKLSYKEFLDRNDTWAMDDRDLCFESQPVFKPMEMAGMPLLLLHLQHLQKRYLSSHFLSFLIKIYGK